MRSPLRIRSPHINRRCLLKTIIVGIVGLLTRPIVILGAQLQTREQRLKAAQDLLDSTKDRDAVLNNLIDTAEADLPFRQELWILMLREKARHDAEKKRQRHRVMPRPKPNRKLLGITLTG